MQENNFQNKPNNGYPQNIQMVPQGVNNQPQAYPQFPNQGHSFEQSESYGNVPPTVIQQGVVYQAVPVNSQYPNQGYPPHAFPSHPFPPQGPQYANYPVSNQMFGTSDQIHLVNPYNQVFMIETQIKSGFCCYTCLVYFGLISSFIGLLSALSQPYHPGVQVLNVAITIAFIVGYYLAIKAKSTFDSKKQHQAYMVFFVMSVIKLLINLLFIKQTVRAVMEQQDDINAQYQNNHNNYNNYNNNNYNGYERKQMEENFVGGLLFGFLIDFCLNLLLTYYSHTLVKLMKDRDQILINLNSTNRVV